MAAHALWEHKDLLTSVTQSLLLEACFRLNCPSTKTSAPCRWLEALQREHGTARSSWPQKKRHEPAAGARRPRESGNFECSSYDSLRPSYSVLGRDQPSAQVRKLCASSQNGRQQAARKKRKEEAEAENQARLSASEQTVERSLCLKMPDMKTRCRKEVKKAEGAKKKEESLAAAKQEEQERFGEGKSAPIFCDGRERSSEQAVKAHKKTSKEGLWVNKKAAFAALRQQEKGEHSDGTGCIPCRASASVAARATASALRWERKHTTLPELRSNSSSSGHYAGLEHQKVDAKHRAFSAGPPSRPLLDRAGAGA